MLVNCISQSSIMFDSLSEGGGCFGEEKKTDDIAS